MMSSMRRLLPLLALLLSNPAAAAGELALDLLDAPVPYTASFTFSGAKGTYQGTVWHRPGRERRDFATAGGSQAVLLDRGKDSAYLIKPASRWYLAVGMRAAATFGGGIDAMTVERHRLRDETVAGQRTTRWRVAATGPRGTRFDGDAWLSRDGIVVKAVGTITAADGATELVETVLSDLKVGATDERMLDLPKGYFGIDLRSIPAEKLEQAVEGMRPMLERQGGR